jgi:hypothetical protein
MLTRSRDGTGGGSNSGCPNVHVHAQKNIPVKNEDRPRRLKVWTAQDDEDLRYWHSCRYAVGRIAKKLGAAEGRYCGSGRRWASAGLPFCMPFTQATALAAPTGHGQSATVQFESSPGMFR